MARDPMVDTIFSHFTPRYLATGVDPNDLDRLKARIDRWADWCRIWSEEAKRHEQHGAGEASKGRRVTAAESYLRAAIYYHYGKHLFAKPPQEFQAAHDNMLRCYSLAAADTDPPMQRLEVPFAGARLHGWLRVPRVAGKPPVAIILPGLDACKEELHAWSDAFLRRGLATLTLDGPGQGETSFTLPISTAWGKAIGAVIDAVEATFPVLRGTIRDYGTLKRRPFLRYFAEDNRPQTRLDRDAGNGMAGYTVPAVLGTAKLGALPLDIVPMYFELDGSFPNHEANPLEPDRKSTRLNSSHT